MGAGIHQKLGKGEGRGGLRDVTNSHCQESLDQPQHFPGNAKFPGLNLSIIPGGILPSSLKRLVQ